MFNMTQIGKTIAKRRKEKNLTQVELADQLLVSYQAVSQWETGKSMPDISNISRLAEVLDIPLHELLGQTESQVVIKVNQEQPLTEEELVEAAPFIKPSKLKSQMKDREFDSGTLIAMAPFLDSETLLEYALVSQMDFGQLVALAPFLDQQHLEQLLESLPDDALSSNRLVALAPFVSSKALMKRVLKSTDPLDPAKLVSLAPFLKQKHLHQIIQTIDLDGPASRVSLVALAPFLSKEDMKYLIGSTPKKKEPVEPDDVEVIVEEPTNTDDPDKLIDQLAKLFKRQNER